MVMPLLFAACIFIVTEMRLLFFRPSLLTILMLGSSGSQCWPWHGDLGVVDKGEAEVIVVLTQCCHGELGEGALASYPELTMTGLSLSLCGSGCCDGRSILTPYSRYYLLQCH